MLRRCCSCSGWVDPFLLSTEERAQHERRRLTAADIDLEDIPIEQRTPKKRPIVLDEEGELYGRRATDIPIRDIKRVIAALEQIKSTSESEAGRQPELAEPPLAHDERTPRVDQEG